MTKQKEAILQAIRAAASHPTADEVHAAAREILPQIGVATVYRNLSSLVNEGLIRRIPIPGEGDRYDGAMRPHEHMRCIVCGTLFDCAVPGLQEAIDRLDLQGAKLVGWHLHLDCICPACLSQETSEKEPASI